MARVWYVGGVGEHPGVVRLTWGYSCAFWRLAVCSGTKRWEGDHARSRCCRVRARSGHYSLLSSFQSVFVERPLFLGFLHHPRIPRESVPILNKPILIWYVSVDQKPVLRRSGFDGCCWGSGWCLCQRMSPVHTLPVIALKHCALARSTFTEFRQKHVR